MRTHTNAHPNDNTIQQEEQEMMNEITMLGVLMIYTATLLSALPPSSIRKSTRSTTTRLEQRTRSGVLSSACTR